jgi:hypothetical protein
LKLNKMSLKKNATTSPQQYNFRQSNDARIPFGVMEEKTTHLPHVSFSYGRRSKPPTPVDTVIGGMYGNLASLEM